MDRQGKEQKLKYNEGSVKCSSCNPNRVMSPTMRVVTGSGRPRIEIIEKTWLHKQWNGEDWGFYKRLMIAAFEDEEMGAIARGAIDRSLLQTDAKRKGMIHRRSS